MQRMAQLLRFRVTWQTITRFEMIHSSFRCQKDPKAKQAEPSLTPYLKMATYHRLTLFTIDAGGVERTRPLRSERGPSLILVHVPRAVQHPSPALVPMADESLFASRARILA
jgi:hypothetical protein